MPQLSEMVKLEEELRFLKRVDIVNTNGNLEEHFEEYRIKGYLEQKVVKYNATMGELNRPTNLGNEVKFYVLNFRVPTVAVRVSDGRVNKTLEISQGDAVYVEDKVFQIYNIINAEKHALKSADLVSWHKPLPATGVYGEITKFWYKYLREVGLSAFVEVPRWDVSNMYGYLPRDFAVYSMENTTNRDDISVLDGTENTTNGLKYTFKYRKFCNIVVKIFSKEDPLRYSNFLCNQKMMYIKNRYTPQLFYNWGILSRRTSLMSTKHVVLNGENYMCSIYSIRFGYTVEEHAEGETFTSLKI